MNTKNIIAAWFVAIILTSCAPVKDISTKQGLLTPTSSPIPSAAILATPIENAVISAHYSGTLFDKGGEILIANPGKVTAQNLQIWICTSQIHNYWKQDIQGISSFIVEPKNLLQEYSQEYLYSDNCLPVGEKKEYNTILLRLKTFSVNQNIELAISMKPDIEMLEKVYKGRVFIKIPTKLNTGTSDTEILNQLIGMFGDTLIHSYFGGKWAVADLSLKVECSNCPTMQEVYSYSFYKDMSIADCKVLTKNALYIKTSCAFSFLYFVSKNSSEFLPEKENLYLLATQSADETNSLVEIKEEQFESDSP